MSKFVQLSDSLTSTGFIGAFCIPSCIKALYIEKSKGDPQPDP